MQIEENKLDNGKSRSRRGLNLEISVGIGICLISSYVICNIFLIKYMWKR